MSRGPFVVDACAECGSSLVYCSPKSKSLVRCADCGALSRPVAWRWVGKKSQVVEFVAWLEQWCKEHSFVYRVPTGKPRGLSDFVLVDDLLSAAWLKARESG